jgi:hypothetical protein
MAASGGKARGPAAGRFSSGVPAGFAVLEYRRQSPEHYMFVVERAA